MMYVNGEDILSNRFYAFIGLLIAFFVFFVPAKLTDSKYYIPLGITCLLIIIGIVNLVFPLYLFPQYLYPFLDSKFEIGDNIYRILENKEYAKEEDYKNQTSYLFAQMTFLLLSAYFSFSLLILLIKKACLKFKKGNLIITGKDYEKALSYLTIILVVFGFLPLVTEFINFSTLSDEDKKKILDLKIFFNQSVLGLFLMAIVPYSYMLLNKPDK